MLLFSCLDAIVWTELTWNAEYLSPLLIRPVLIIKIKRDILLIHPVLIIKNIEKDIIQLVRRLT